MEVSEDIQRELVYGLNAQLLACSPELPSGRQVAERLLAILRDEAPRFHEPHLVQAWADDAGGIEVLSDELADALDLILEELEDEEEPFTAHQLLTLLAQEPFWTLTWGASGGQSHVPLRPVAEAAVVLPLPLRAELVRVLDQLELALFELHTDQRSVHDRLDDALVDGLVAASVRTMRQLGRARKIEDLTRSLPRLGELLGRLQRWKLGVGFDASPDDDDGEWTMRVLERVYGIEWIPEKKP